MDLTDVELRENLPVGILLDSDTKALDRFGYSFALSGVDLETCVTFSCVKEVIRLSPVQVIIAEREFVGGTISDLVELRRQREKSFKIFLWTEKRNGLTNSIISKAGINGIILKTHPFDKVLKKVKDAIVRKKF